jgi:hypothetical protein
MGNAILYSTELKPVNDLQSVKITIAINSELLNIIDYLAKRDYTTRSGILRQALIEFVRQPKNMPKNESKSEYEETINDHPYVDPADLVLLDILKKFNQADQAEV